MSILKTIVFGSFAFVILLGAGAAARGEISSSNNSYEESYVSEMSDEEMSAYLESIVAEYSDDSVQSQATAQPTPQPAPQPAAPASEPAYSETHQTAPMPEETFSGADLIGKWVDDSNPDQVRVLKFYTENNQLMYKHTLIVPGNSIGFNLANETTEWDCCDGMVSVMGNQGNIYCHKGTKPDVSISFYYGFDGANVMYDQEDGAAYYRVE